jgi:hypothetical protein
MGTATGIIVFAAGAIMRFAVTATSTDFNVHSVGVILMIVGAVAFVVSLFFWSTWAGFGARGRGGVTTRDRTVVQQDGMGGAVATRDRQVI